jgi:5'-methylthioadenosine phosphorylase
MEEERAKLGVIGGSGLYELGLLSDDSSVTIHTPYGPHSDGLRVGTIGATRVAFLPRHGVGHRIPPHRVPYRANLWALHALGVRRLLTVSAMGGMRPEYRIGDACVPDQVIDWTRGRTTTFFDGPEVVHTPFAEPFCPELRSALHAACQQEGIRSHDGGTVVVFEGPRFSTRAESMMYRHALDGDLLSMTAMPEAILARELGVCYGSVAVVSDLDAFGSEPVDADAVNDVMRRTLPRVVRVVRQAVASLEGAAPCETCRPPEGSPYRRS